ncbi:related to BDP1-essential subunit of RNA polymerase III transcription factor [Sporisorium reilianum f. sp. reilianum]|uniref:Related to BDP1-essential subunit of RNA polymerase III transcription factor n=1 Tax=Sporisorium reilianum f. sp. reilianum TaxID=72559 RepID=A0A2N8U725_9BASI|nr:related to BDP1-essential subunit of RNA polymerase III transcription factor [Sporisorium reilianum f. sp. reilianum]
MSSRIEKGGPRFKPSIVPRRSATGAPSATASSSTTTPQAQSQQQQQQPRSTSTAPPPPPSPSLAPQVTSRKSRPPPVRSKGPNATANAVTASPAAQSFATPVTPSASSQSYAFNVSPSVISKQGGAAATARISNAAGQPSASSSKSKPVFRRPSVSKPRPGSRTSLTPAPHFAQSSASLTPSLPVLPLIDLGAQGDADTADLSTRTDAPPSIGGARSGRNVNASANEPVIDKASQPDPVQAPRVSTRPRGSSTIQSNAPAPVKQSASQQQAQSSVRPQRRAAATPSVDKAAEASSQTSSKKGKTRETAATDSAPQTVKAGSQAANVAAEETEQERAQRAAQRRMNAAARLQKRRLKRKEQSSGKPKRPLSAYLLFVNSVRPARQAQNPDMPLTELTAEMAAEWRELAPAQRTRWEAEAALLRQQYDAALDAWKVAYPEGVSLGPEDESDMETSSEIGDDGQPVRRKKRRTTSSRKPHTVSDDEEEYRKQLYHEGEQLAASRIDPANVTMADLSTTEYKRGRAGPRTFEAERVYKRLVHDRRAAAKSAVLGEHVLGEKVNLASPSPAPAANIIRTANGVPVATGAEERLDGEEEIVGDQTGESDGGETSEVDESAPETDADGTTDGEGGETTSRRARKKRESSVAGTEVSFRENRFAVQTRIVDGKIVLDEMSLFANYGNGEDDRDNMEVIDEREGDRFVNAATYSRKLGRNRKWTADETAKFYRSLQQWGTDFEMIARLFPGRDRVMIKKKFNVEERSNPKLVDEALKNSVPVNLEAYALAIGVDLSGPPPEIKADLHDIESLAAATASGTSDAAVKKREGTAALSGRKGERSDAEQDGDGDDDDGYEYEEVVEVDDDGNEQVIRRRLGKKPGSKAGKKRRNSTRKNSTSTPAPAPAPPATESAAAAATATSAVDAMEAEPAAASSGSRAKPSRAGGPPSIGSRKSARATRNRAASINSSREAPGDGMEVEEIVGEL